MVSVSEVYESSESTWTIDVTLSTDKPAAFVWLDFTVDRRGRFSDNGFLLATPTKTVSFWCAEETSDSELFRQQLTVLHLAQIIR